MKKIFIILILFITIFLNANFVQAVSNETSNDEILSSQQKELGISDFINISKKYTEDNLDGIDIKDLFNSAITGRVGNINLFNNVLNLLGREFKGTISSLRNNIYNNSNT